MKFPKEVARIVGIVKQACNQEDYKEIYKLKDELFLNYDDLKDDSVFNSLVKSAFHLGMYDEDILIGEELLKRGYESHEALYYILLSCLANNDIYHALSIIKRSKIINHPETKKYLANDGANYSLLLGLSHKTPSILLLLIIANLINGIGIEMMLGLDVNLEYIFGRMLELIDQLYEMGYHIEIINELTKVVKMIFLN